MLGKKAEVASQLCSEFPHIFVWHCLNHHLELAVGDVMKEVSGLNHFQICASPKNQRELEQCAQEVWQRLLMILRVLSIRWVHDRFCKAANDTSGDSSDRAKWKGLDDVRPRLLSHLSATWDALTELSNLSQQLQKREMTLPEADGLLTWVTRAFESMISIPGPHVTTACAATEENSFMSVTLRMNSRLGQIQAGHFFCSLADNMRHQMTSPTSSYVSSKEKASHDHYKKLVDDMKVLDPGSWPKEELDIQYGVHRLCEVLKVEKKETVHGCYDPLPQTRYPGGQT